MSSNGWATLGTVLGGGGEMRQNSYNNGVMQGARSADLLEEAASKRNKNVAMQAMTADLVQKAQAGDPQAQAQLMATASQAGIDPQHITGAQKDQQSMGFATSAMAEAMKPNADLNLINRENMVRNGKPVDLSTVQGNTLISQMVTPDQQAAIGGNVPTDIGQAMIATQGADAGAANARASASYASAARQRAGIGADKAANYEITPDATGNMVRINKLTGEVAPLKLPDGSPMAAAINGKGVGTGTSMAPTEAAPTLMKSVFGEPKVGGGPDQNVANFLAWKADKASADPRYNNGNFAVQQWALQGQPPIGADTIMNPDGTPVSPAQFKAAKERPGTIASAMNGVPSSEGVMTMSSAPLSISKSDTTFGSQPSAGAPVQPKSRAEFDALPKGAQFINPSDGRLMVKK